VLENTNKSTDAIEIAIEKKEVLEHFLYATFSESLRLIFYDLSKSISMFFLLLS